MKIAFHFLTNFLLKGDTGSEIDVALDILTA